MMAKLYIRNVVAYTLICFQLLNPLLSVILVLVVALRATAWADTEIPSEKQYTLQGLDSLILGQDTHLSGNAVAPAVPENKEKSAQAERIVPADNMVSGQYQTEDFYFQPQSKIPNPPTNTSVAILPDLSVSPDSSDDKESVPDSGTGGTEGTVASGINQLGGLLSEKNSAEAAINYSRSLGEGLINQQINDWLNQYGNAKISVGTHQKLSGDFLLPVYETNDSLFFSQIGARTNQERNTVNLGIGYRQYLDDWMFGVNSFYDYDYTGKNKRIGAGVEAWTDYLKLSANGYMRQSDWHQSALDNMEDYDERPANGFDLRLNGWFPSWPNLGGNLKYEQYFGKGVSVTGNTSPDSLKDDPTVVTAGLDYTPFPLLTLSAKRSVGDSSDTNVGLEFNYRFGVPWSQQTDPDAVGLLRSLSGSRYDFVDRNYDIVMQYRKQELLNIRLPERMTAQSAETVRVTLTVARAKYGLKDVNWNVDPTLTAHGGSYQVLSPTELQVKVPAYIFNNAPSQDYRISAVASDNRGNESNTTETIISVIPSDKVVGNLVLSPADTVLTVNTTKGYTITGIVMDSKGVPQAGQSVTFSVDGFAGMDGQSGATISSTNGKQRAGNSEVTVTTEENGKAIALLRSTVAGEGTVTATMDNGNSGTVSASFVADSTTATVASVVAVDDNAAADGNASNSVLVTVTDKYGNVIEGAEVYFNASNGAVVAEKAITDSEGVAKVTLTSTRSGMSTVTASLNDSSKDVAVTFSAGQPARQTSSIKTDKNEYISGDDIAVTVELRDELENAVTGEIATLTESTVTLQNAFVKPGSNWAESSESPGKYTRLFVAKTTGENLTATLSLSGWSRPSENRYKISANIHTAEVSGFDVRDNNAVADGQAINSVLVTVTDSYGNPVSGANVSFSATNGASITNSAITGADGTVLVTLVSQNAGASTVTASINDSSKDITIAFGVGVPVAARSGIALDANTYTTGDNMTVTVTLQDANQNGVAGQSASLAAAVSVQNATLQGNWADNGDGTYTATYVATTAGTGLKASLQMNNWSSVKQTPLYTINVPLSVPEHSSITLDRDTYISGDDITATVILKDINQNAVTEMAGLLPSAVTVPNATLKSGSNWTDNGNGTYAATYTAHLTGTGLKSELRMGNWSSAKQSESYTIIAGAADQNYSSIALDNTSYISGNDIIATVTLKDANQNTITGLSDLLAVEVPNAQLKSGSSWADNGDGTYTATYVAITAGTGLKASLQMNSWSSEKMTEPYIITAGAPVPEKSSIALDKSAYASGEAMMYWVTLKDINGNPVTGRALELRESGVVIVPNSSYGIWLKEIEDGVYENMSGNSFKATHAATGLRASLQMSGWSTAIQSEPYSITVNYKVIYEAAPEGLVKIVSSDDEWGRYPTTGFEGAVFRISSSDINYDRIVWSSNAEWAQVDGIGRVTFVGMGSGEEVTITARPENNAGDVFTYTFRLRDWFTMPSGTAEVKWEVANEICSSRGYSLPTMNQLVKHENYNPPEQKLSVGTLLTEWAGRSFGKTDLRFWASDVVSGSTGRYSVRNHIFTIYNGQSVATPVCVLRF